MSKQVLVRHVGKKPLPFQYNGRFYTLPIGDSEWPEDVAKYLVRKGKFILPTAEDVAEMEKRQAAVRAKSELRKPMMTTRQRIEQARAEKRKAAAFVSQPVPDTPAEEPLADTPPEPVQPANPATGLGEMTDGNDGNSIHD
jgi:hypothetical protein